MSPDLFFFITLAIKMAVAGLFVISATVIAERAGAFIGALVLTLPVSAGPAYIFLSLDHDAAFLTDGALASLSNNVATFVYTLAFVFIAQRFHTFTSVALSLLIWAALTYGLQQLHWTALTAVIANIGVFLLCFLATRSYANAPMPRIALRFTDILLRGILVAMLVAAVVTLSFVIGPAGTGVLAAFPVVFTSIMLILHRRVGAAATAAVIAHGYPGLLGFGMALLTLHATVIQFGKTTALLLALAAAMAWNGALFAARRYAAA